MDTSSSPWLIVGLGNPGLHYAEHRHNIGFMLLDRLANYYHAGNWTRKFQGDCTETPRQCPMGRQILLKPQTFMNLSGSAVQATASFYKIPPESIVVIHDELDLPPGKVRVKQGGGAGGHNGLKSIDSCIGQDYWRIRLGIGHPGEKDKVSDYVLSNIPKQDVTLYDAPMEMIAQNLPLLLSGDAQGFIQKLSSPVQSA